MKYKHIVFDVDGTLINAEYDVLHSLQKNIRALSGREMPVAAIAELAALKFEVL